eukprot:1186589-Prorocentrum_minimum.AAC.1
MKLSYHSREDSILPRIVYGRHMSVSSPTPHPFSFCRVNFSLSKVNFSFSRVNFSFSKVNSSRTIYVRVEPEPSRKFTTGRIEATYGEWSTLQLIHCSAELWLSQGVHVSRVRQRSALSRCRLTWTLVPKRGPGVHRGLERAYLYRTCETCTPCEATTPWNSGAAGAVEQWSSGTVEQLERTTDRGIQGTT